MVASKSAPRPILPPPCSPTGQDGRLLLGAEPIRRLFCPLAGRIFPVEELKSVRWPMGAGMRHAGVSGPSYRIDRGRSGACVFRGCLAIARVGKSVTQSAHTTTCIVMRAKASGQVAPISCDRANNTSGVKDKIRTTVATIRHVRSGFGTNIIFTKTKIATTVQRIVSMMGGATVRGTNSAQG